MTDKKAQLKKLYEDAVYLHQIHSGHKAIKGQFEIILND